MVWVFVHGIRLLPRGLARAIGAVIGAIAFRVLGRLRRVGLRNLEMAFPEMTAKEREAILQFGVSQSGTAAGRVLQDAGLYGGDGEPVYPL